MGDSQGPTGARGGVWQPPQVDSDRLSGLTTRPRQPQHPLRTCLGCRRRDEQAHLVRVVARDGALVVDARGSLTGRGAYVHRDRDCVTESIRRKTWARALKVPGPLADAQLWEDLDGGPHPKGERP